MAAFPDLIELAEARGSRRRLDPGEVLIVQGRAGQEVYLLLSGALTVTRRIEGGEMRLAMIHEVGAIVGEVVPMAGGERTATVTAVETTEVLELSREVFRQLLQENPALAERVSAEAVRRSEEAELAELVAERFSVTDPAAVDALRPAVEWVRLGPGDVLFREGDESDSVSFVIRGAVEATRWDEVEQVESVLGHIGRGETVGEVGLVGDARRMATVTALRTTVLARIDAAGFRELIESNPGLMLDIGLAMTIRGGGSQRHRGSEHGVLAVVVCDRFDGSVVVGSLVAALGQLGSVECLSSERVSGILDVAGIGAAGPGELGDVQVARLLDEAELSFDHLLLDASESVGYWARRCLEAADAVVLVVPPDPTPDETARLRRVLDSGPPPLRRTLAVLYASAPTAPTGSKGLMEAFEASDILHVGPSDRDMGRLARTVTGRATGLVLGGGGARGFAHLGVYQALHELGVEIDVFAGTSMGSILAALMADGLPHDEIVGFVAERFRNILDYTIPLVSLIKGDRIARALRGAFGERDIEDLKFPFAGISTDLTTSRIRYHRRGAVVEALRAGSSIPGVMPPVPHGDHLLVDGGVLNNLPVDVVRQMTPAGRVIAVDVAPLQGPGARADFGLSVSGWQELQGRIRGRSKGAPGITAVLMRSMIVASQRERDHQIAEGLADLYLDLDLRGVSMLDFDDVAVVARRGYEAAKPRLEAWLSSG